MNYETATDDEINEAVELASRFNNVDADVRIVTYNGMRKVMVNNYASPYGITDFCNDWSAAGPIILEAKVDTWWEDTPGIEEWSVTKHVDGVDYYSCHKDNPLRAAMIVFLKMQGEEG